MPRRRKPMPRRDGATGDNGCGERAVLDASHAASPRARIAAPRWREAALRGTGTRMVSSRVVPRVLAPTLFALIAAAGCRSSAKPKVGAAVDAGAPPPPVAVDAAVAIDAAAVVDVVDAAPTAVGPDAACPPQHPCTQACQRGHAHTTKLIDGCQVTVCCAPIDAP